jgi:glycerophosphoryl diester phosphodiesterase
MQILAHRGLWADPDDRNSLGALRRALDAGHGHETDVRDRLGELVISHDPPTGTEALPLSSLLAAYRSSGSTATLAINIKSDGLHDRLAATLGALPAAR